MSQSMSQTGWGEATEILHSLAEQLGNTMCKRGGDACFQSTSKQPNRRRQEMDGQLAVLQKNLRGKVCDWRVREYRSTEHWRCRTAVGIEKGARVDTCTWRTGI